MGETAVVYHSYHGNVRAVAEVLAEKTGADLFELTLPGLDGLKGFWMYARLGFLASFRRKPAIGGGEVDLSEYGNIIIGSPVWSGTFSPAIRSFLADRPSLSARKIGAFLCHKGGPGKAAEDLRKAVGTAGSFFAVGGVEPGINGTAGELAGELIAKMGL